MKSYDVGCPEGALWYKESSEGSVIVVRTVPSSTVRVVIVIEEQFRHPQSVFLVHFLQPTQSHRYTHFIFVFR